MRVHNCLRTSLFVLLLVSLIKSSFSQKITNIESEYGSGIVKVTFDIKSAENNERYKPSLRFKTESGKMIKPDAIKGDTGYQKSGEGKQITWNVSQEYDQFFKRVKPVMGFKDIFHFLGGPENALLSVAVPGLGAHGVYAKRETYLNYRTFLVYSAIGYGIYQQFQKQDYYDKYKNATEQEEIDKFYQKANDAHKRSHYAFVTGGVLWIADITSTLIKGFQNNKANEQFRSRHQSVNISYDARSRSFMVGLHYQF